MTQVRNAMKAKSNNTINPNQNVCAVHVARGFGVADDVRYLHTYPDVKRAISKRFSVRSRKSSIKSKTVGGARKQILEMLKAQGAIAAIIYVEGHVLSISHTGAIIDTDPRQRDRRPIKRIHFVFKPRGC